MNCHTKHGSSHHRHAGNGCCCGGGRHSPLGNHMWSTKKKIRFLEDRLKELNTEKSDLQELIDELKAK